MEYRHLNEGDRVPDAVFVTREGDAPTCGDKSGVWKRVPARELFGGKRIIVFAIPGAFTPTCTSAHLPGYEAAHDALAALGIDAVYCLSVNDAFVMHQWALALGVRNVHMLPDGNGDFSRGMGMLVKKENLGFGARSWRYSMFVEDGVIQKLFVEPGMRDDANDDPFGVSSAEAMREYLEVRRSA